MLDPSSSTDIAGAPETEAEAKAEDSTAAPAQTLTKYQIDRLAVLIADDEAAFPNEFAAADRNALSDAVRLILKARMVKFIAREIALDLEHALAGKANKVQIND